MVIILYFHLIIVDGGTANVSPKGLGLGIFRSKTDAEEQRWEYVFSFCLSIYFLAYAVM